MNEVDIKEIKETYKEYCDTVSKYGHPMSIESVIWMVDLINEGGFKKIADFGSGFSSYAIRKYCNVENHSFDTDAGWLEKTKNYLEQKSLTTDNLFVHNDESIAEDYDLVLWDLGNKDFRKTEFLRLIGYFQNSTCIIDDCHDPRYINMCRELGRGDDWDLEEITEVTDEFGRYVSVLRRS